MPTGPQRHSHTAMTKPISVQSLYASHGEKLALRWLNSETGAEREISAEDSLALDASLIGYMNLIRPHRLQVLGSAEMTYLQALGKNSYQDTLNHLFEAAPAAVLIANDEALPDGLLQTARDHGTALFSTPMNSHKLISLLHNHFTQLFAARITVHGVFMAVMGIGVLLTGPSSVGKSELALELISRGHRLIADDAPEFQRVGPDILSGSCPETLRDFLEVRGLGVLNIRAMYGDNALKPNKFLRLILRLEPLANIDLDDMRRLQGTKQMRKLLDVDVSEIVLPVAPGRNLAVIVEAAVRNHILSVGGYDASDDFMYRQQHHILNPPT